ncbi:MAG: hypothetical protein P1V81_10155 [Planctomycetota bacterium]|nr:hypothetical protein [Planctomycetota bacterium]
MAPNPRPTLLVDIAIGTSIGLGFTGLFLLLMQDRPFGDGPLLVQVLSWPDLSQRTWIHPLFPTAIELLRSWLGVSVTARAMELVSALSGALGLALCFAASRTLGAGAARSAFATLAFGLSPVVLFFSTTIEVHGLQLLSIAVLVLLLARCIRWRTAWTFGAVLFWLPIAIGVHQTAALLAPGVCLGLFALARKRSVPGSRRRNSLAVVAGTLTSACLALLFFIGSSRSLGSEGLDQVWAQLVVHLQGPSLSTLVEGLLAPLGLAIFLPFAALLVGSKDRLARDVLLLSVVLPVGFFLLWGVPERGGYLMGVVPFLIVACALAEPEREPRALALVGACLLLAQASLGYRSVRAFDTPEWSARREVKFELGRLLLAKDGHLLLSLDRNRVVATRDHASIVELNLLRLLEAQVGAGSPPEAFAAVSLAGVEALEGAHGLPILFSRLYLGDPDHGSVLQPYVDALEQAILARFEVERLDHMGIEHWLLLEHSAAR